MLLYAGKKQSHPQQLADNLIMIGKKWDFCLMTYTVHSCVFQSQFRSSFCLARHSFGLDPSVTLVCSKRDLLDMWLLPYVASPWLDREINPRSNCYSWLLDHPCSSDDKESACSAGDLDSIPGSERSSGEGNGNLLQYSCLENPMNRGAWWAEGHGVTGESDMTQQLNNNNSNKYS